jgi:hypothetical protein
MPPGRYTGLFFLDDATALAAGHRPCAECRNEDYRSFLALTGAPTADDLDRRLHAERGELPERALDDLPDGAFVLLADEPWLVLGSELLRWTPGGYGERQPRFSDSVGVITPPTSLQVLASGWSGSVPLVHPLRGVTDVVLNEQHVPGGVDPVGNGPVDHSPRARPVRKS